MLSQGFSTQYYLGWCGLRSGEDTQSIFERVIEESTTYKAKALTALATIQAERGDFQLGFKYYAEAMKYSNNPSGLVQAMRSVIAVHGMEGCHHRALKDLRDLSSVAKYASPLIKYQYLNSLAVELGEAGRIQEAQGVCKIVLASPFAFAYPEWQETANEIALRAYKSRSSVSVLQPASENVVALPIPEEKPPTQTEPARVLSYLDWKKKMGQEDYNSMTETDLVFKIFNLAAEQSDNWLRLRKIVDYILKVSSEPC